MKLLNYVIVAVALWPITGYGQIDRPVSPEDFADKLTAEQSKNRDQMKVLSAVRANLNALANSGNTDPKTVAPLVHVDLMICLANGDFTRAETNLYGLAAAAADQIATAWDRKANSPVLNTPTASEEAFTRQVEELESRARELGAKAELTEEERRERLAFEGRRSQLREALNLFAQVRSSAADGAQYAAAAKQMRAKEHLFRLKADDSRLQSLAHDIQCSSGVLTLRALKEREQLQKELERWGATSGVEPEKAPAAPPMIEPRRNADAPSPSMEHDLENLRKYVKDIADSVAVIDNQISNPAVLEKKLERQKTLSSPIRP